jgi:hypothetical protein
MVPRPPLPTGGQRSALARAFRFGQVVFNDAPRLREQVRSVGNARFKILSGGRLRLPKMGDVPVRWSRDLPSAPASVGAIICARPSPGHLGRSERRARLARGAVADRSAPVT